MKKKLFAVILLCIMMLSACADGNMSSDQTKLQVDSTSESGGVTGKESASENDAITEIEMITEEETESETNTEDTTFMTEKVNSELTEVELSNELFSFQSYIDGMFYELPIRYEDLIAAGWEYTGKEEQDIKPDSYIVAGLFVKENKKLYTYIYNGSDMIQKVSECWIAGYYTELVSIGEDETTIVLPKNIILYKSSFEDVLEAYGTPTNQYNGDTTISITYTLQPNVSVKFGINREKNVVDEIEVKRFTLDEIALKTDVVETERTTEEADAGLVEFSSETEVQSKGDDILVTDETAGEIEADSDTEN